jgi:DNA polymerase III subunit epsilon
MKYRPIFYDLETTGVRPEEDRIVEIAAYDLYRDKRFAMLVNPKRKIPLEASKIHNITDEMVENSPPFSTVALEFIEFCEGSSVLIAHNNDAFDQLFLAAEYKREEISLPKFSYIDSLKWARKYRPDLPRHSLQFLREVYGIEKNQAHRALDDVETLAKVFMFMVDDLPMETVMDLMSGKAKPLTTMPFGKYQGRSLQDVPKDYITWLNKNGVFEKPSNKELKEAFIKVGSIGA